MFSGFLIANTVVRAVVPANLQLFVDGHGNLVYELRRSEAFQRNAAAAGED